MSSASTANAAFAGVDVVVFKAFNRYAGMAIGEHLGFLCSGVWTFLIAAVFSKTGFVRPWLTVLGMVVAVGIELGVFGGRRL